MSTEAALQLAKDAMDVEDAKDEYVVAGERRLLQQASAGDMDKLRELFDAFERKRDLLELLDAAPRDGVQIFIGEEAGYEVLSDYSVITAPTRRYAACWCAGCHRPNPHGVRACYPFGRHHGKVTDRCAVALNRLLFRAPSSKGSHKRSVEIRAVVKHIYSRVVAPHFLGESAKFRDERLKT